MNLFPNLTGTLSDFNKVVNESQNKAIFTRGVEIQKEEVKALRNYLNELEKVKSESIKRGNEKDANLILCLQFSVKAIEKELLMLINLKEDKMDEAWDCLVESQNLIQNVIKNHPLGGEYLLGYASRLKGYEKLLFPKMMFSSAGTIIKNSECSICNGEYSECDHIKGTFYMGKMCQRIIKEIDELEEISTVENPDDKRCRAKAIIDRSTDGVEYETDLLTLRTKTLQPTKQNTKPSKCEPAH
ncbi:MAG: hypothetical protein ACFB15_10860 [Cyclobacteriaceae bacterium]